MSIDNDQELTVKQRALLRYIEDERNWEPAKPPSVRKIARALGLRSSSSVHDMIKRVRKKGYLNFDDYDE